MQLTEMTMFTDDVDATAEFWGTFFDTDPHVHEEEVAIFDVGGVTVLIHETYDPGPEELPPEDHLAFATGDVDGTYENLVEAGLEGFREPADYEWGRSAYLEDPDGRLIELTE